MEDTRDKLRNFCDFLIENPKYIMDNEYGCREISNPLDRYEVIGILLSSGDIGICEYEDMLNPIVIGDRTDNGCDFIHTRGPLLKSKCGKTVHNGSSRCKFHSQMIFNFNYREAVKELLNL